MPKSLEVFKMNSFSRIATALMLVASVLMGSIAGFAQTTRSTAPMGSTATMPIPMNSVVVAGVVVLAAD